jgi:hypothetical protein
MISALVPRGYSNLKSSFRDAPEPTRAKQRHEIGSTVARCPMGLICLPITAASLQPSSLQTTRVPSNTVQICAKLLISIHSCEARGAL